LTFFEARLAAGETADPKPRLRPRLTKAAGQLIQSWVRARILTAWASPITPVMAGAKGGCFPDPFSVWMLSKAARPIRRAFGQSAQLGRHITVDQAE